MVEIIQSASFSEWLRNLKDREGRMRIHAKLDRVGLGNLGDVRPIGHGLSELRIHYGPGYRLYYMQPETNTLVMLYGGDKSSQNRDIEQARQIAKNWKGVKNG